MIYRTQSYNPLWSKYIFHIQDAPETPNGF